MRSHTVFLPSHCSDPGTVWPVESTGCACSYKGDNHQAAPAGRHGHCLTRPALALALPLREACCAAAEAKPCRLRCQISASCRTVASIADTTAVTLEGAEIHKASGAQLPGMQLAGTTMNDIWMPPCSIFQPHYQVLLTQPYSVLSDSHCPAAQAGGRDVPLLPLYQPCCLHRAQARGSRAGFSLLLLPRPKHASCWGRGKPKVLTHPCPVCLLPHSRTPMK